MTILPSSLVSIVSTILGLSHVPFILEAQFPSSRRTPSLASSRSSTCLSQSPVMIVRCPFVFAWLKQFMVFHRFTIVLLASTWVCFSSRVHISCNTPVSLDGALLSSILQGQIRDHHNSSHGF